MERKMSDINELVSLAKTTYPNASEKTVDTIAHYIAKFRREHPEVTLDVADLVQMAYSTLSAVRYSRRVVRR
jgi:hypothetical protein